MSKLIIVSSVSGGGKTTLVDSVVSLYNLHKLKTCTTRPIREEEKGNEYHFINNSEFTSKISNSEFYEYANVYGNYYGILKTEIEISKTRNSIVILDVQGTRTIKYYYPQAITIFIEPPSVSELKKRIMSRNTSEADIKSRISQIDTEINEIKNFDYTIKSDSLSNMNAQFSNILKSIL